MADVLGDSTVKLFDELADHYAKRSCRNQDHVHSRLPLKRLFKRKIFNRLFASINGPLKRTPGRLDPLPIFQVRLLVMQCVFDLRTRRKYDAAARLEELCADQLRDAGADSEIKDMFSFLLCLVDTNSENTMPLIGQISSLPVLADDIDLPSGPLNYGDTRRVRPGNFHFTLFPKETFDGLSRPLSNQDITEGERFLRESVSATPGSGIYSMLRPPSTGRMSLSRSFGGREELWERNRFPSSISENSLMGALSQVGGRAPSGSSFMRLELPDLLEHGPVLFRPRALHGRAGRSIEASEDEGFNESSVAPSCSLTPAVTELAPDPLLRALHDLQNPRPLKFTWEARGRGCPSELSEPESGYISEANSLASDCAVALQRHQLASLRPGETPQVDPVALNCASRSAYRELIGDILNLLMGLPSDTYPFDRANLKFYVGATSGSLRFLALSGAQLALRPGSHYARLRALIRLGWADPVMRAFCAALESHLNAYRACLLALEQRKANLGFLELCRCVRGLSSQIEHLTQLCNLSLDEEELDLRSCLPKGIELLACLYQKIQDYCGSHVGVVMLAVFREACRPFVQFLHDWAFRGFCRGGPDEFLIQTNEIYLNNNDKKYWCHAYELKGMRCYLLPETLMNDIFRCGKSLNLLRRIAPNHYIFTAAGSVPRLTLTLSPRATEWQLTSVQSYVSRMKQLGWQRRTTRQQQHLREELAKQELIRLAKETTLEQLERLRSRAAEAFRAEQARKRAALAELRREAEAAAERRTAEKMAEKEEDRRYIQEVAQREQELRVYSQDMERQVRDDLVAYYSRLTADAAFRELRALWRLRRHQLDSKRRLFLMREEARWRQAMERHHETTNLQVSILSMTDPSLSFMRSASMLEETMAEPEAEQNNSALIGAQVGAAMTEEAPPWATPKVGPAEGAGTKPPLPPKPKRAMWAAARKPLLLGPPDPEGPDEDRERLETFRGINRHGQAAHWETDAEEMERRERRRLERFREVNQSSEGAGKETDVEETERRERRRLERFREVNQSSEGAGKETDAEEMERRAQEHLQAFKERNRFGHASEVSLPCEERRSQVPIEERPLGALLESDPGRLEALEESGAAMEGPGPRLARRGSSGALLESDHAAVAAKERQRLDRFRVRNQFGHASQSTVQRLLYGADFGQTGGDPTDGGKEALDGAEDGVGGGWGLARAADYCAAFDFDLASLEGRPNVAALSERSAASARGLGLASVYDEAREDEEEDGSLLPLPVIMRKTLVKPLLSQIRLINDVALNFFMVELDIRKYFTSLRHFLLLEDGEFGDSLYQLLFEKVASKPHEVCDVAFLNQVLATALHHSRFGSAPLADKLSFVLRTRPSATATTPSAEGPSDAPFDYLGLSCCIEWPVNIVITENSLSKYNKIFSFLLQMKFAVWAANDVHFKLRRDALAHPILHQSPQMRRLHLCRHDMEHLLKVLENYICQQVSQVTWNELQDDLAERTQHLDDLRRVHAEYLNRGLHRCLLTPKLRLLMKVVLGTFGHVHRFRRLLLAHPWSVSAAGQAMPSHPNYERLLSTHSACKEHTRFLHRVMSKLVRRGARQRHLEQFLLLLDFTNHYAAAGPAE